jgi:hypothetical protein
MTLNRKWAQRSCGRKIDDVSFTGCHYFYFFHPFGGAAKVLHQPSDRCRPASCAGQRYSLT